jgi:ubiquinone/menaquinone biosynthesis C-methylase UbiE
MRSLPLFPSSRLIPSPRLPTFTPPRPAALPGPVTTRSIPIFLFSTRMLSLTRSTEHYRKVPDVYHSSWFYRCGSPYEKWLMDLILDCFKINMRAENTVIADLGGGTGRCASLLHDAADIKLNVLCVDPSADMLALAQQRPGVDILEQDCVAFASSLLDRSFDIFLLKEMIHHVPVELISEVFANLYRGLRSNGLCLVVTRPSVNIDYPFFEAAKTIWRKAQPDAQVYKDAMLTSGFQSVVVREHIFPVRMQQSAWLGAIADRVWSTFSHDNFSDDELERGIIEIAAQHPPDERGDIEFKERLIFIEGLKC